MDPNRSLSNISKKFNQKLKVIFTDRFLKKIYRYMPNKIKLNPSARSPLAAIGYVITKSPGYYFKLLQSDTNYSIKSNEKKIPNKSKRIFLINKNIEKNIDVLIHEFIHLIDQRNKSKRFPEIGKMVQDLTNNTEIINPSTKPYYIRELFPVLSVELPSNADSYYSMFNKSVDTEKVIDIINKYKIYNPSYINSRVRWILDPPTFRGMKEGG